MSVDKFPRALYQTHHSQSVKLPFTYTPDGNEDFKQMIICNVSESSYALDVTKKPYVDRVVAQHVKKP